MDSQLRGDAVDDDTPGAENDEVTPKIYRTAAEKRKRKRANRKGREMQQAAAETAAETAAAAASRQPQQQQQPQQQLHPAPVAFPAQWQQFRGTQPHFNMGAPTGMPALGVPPLFGPVAPHGQPMHCLCQAYHISIVFITSHCSPFGSAYRPYAIEISWEEALEIAYRPERLLVRFSEVAIIVSRRGFLTHVAIVRVKQFIHFPFQLHSDELHSLAYASWCMVCYNSMRRRVRCLNHPVMQIVAEYM